LAARAAQRILGFMTAGRGVTWAWWALGAALAVAAGVAIAVWRAPATVELPLDAAPRKEAPPAHLPAPMPAPPTLAAAPAADPPPGVSAAQWQALQAELAGRPEELRRLVDYFGFADRLQRFRALRAAGAGAEMLPLAREIDAGLDERLLRRELSAPEARLIKLAVLEVLQPDESQRQAALSAWEDAVPRRTAPDPAVAAREAEFQRRQAEIVATWSARPAAQRDRQALERDLEALRRSSFDTPR
jgi:hypothetical protein